MQAFRVWLSAKSGRSASLLNFNPNMECYFSMHAQNALFGANFDAYSMKWTSSPQVQPEHEPAAVKKAMRWAVLAVQAVSMQ